MKQGSLIAVHCEVGDQAGLRVDRILLLAHDRLDHAQDTGLGQRKTRVRWKITRQLEDLDYADDIALLSST